MRNIVIGWILVPILSLGSAILFMELKLKSDVTIMATYGLLLILPIVLVVRGTWCFSKSKGWSAILGIVLAAVQVIIISVAALFWLMTLAIMFSSYK